MAIAQGWIGVEPPERPKPRKTPPGQIIDTVALKYLMARNFDCRPRSDEEYSERARKREAKAEQKKRG